MEDRLVAWTIRGSRGAGGRLVAFIHEESSDRGREGRIEEGEEEPLLRPPSPPASEHRFPTRPRSSRFAIRRLSIAELVIMVGLIPTAAFAATYPPPLPVLISSLLFSIFLAFLPVFTASATRDTSVINTLGSLYIILIATALFTRFEYGLIDHRNWNLNWWNTGLMVAWCPLVVVAWGWAPGSRWIVWFQRITGKIDAARGRSGAGGAESDVDGEEEEHFERRREPETEGPRQRPSSPSSPSIRNAPLQSDEPSTSTHGNSTTSSRLLHILKLLLLSLSLAFLITAFQYFQWLNPTLPLAVSLLVIFSLPFSLHPRLYPTYKTGTNILTTLLVLIICGLFLSIYERGLWVDLESLEGLGALFLWLNAVGLATLLFSLQYISIFCRLHNQSSKSASNPAPAASSTGLSLPSVVLAAATRFLMAISLTERAELRSRITRRACSDHEEGASWWCAVEGWWWAVGYWWLGSVQMRMFYGCLVQVVVVVLMRRRERQVEVLNEREDEILEQRE